MRNMVFEFIISEGAKQDIIEIVDWYESKKKGLGNRFYNELLFEFEKITERPASYTFYNKDFRRAIPKHFPYLIIFKVYEKEIVVYAIVYGGRNPALISKKIK